MDSFDAYMVGLKEGMTDEEILESKKKERMSFVCENNTESATRKIRTKIGTNYSLLDNISL